MAEPPSVETKSESLTIYYGQDCVPKAPMSEFLLKMDFTCAFQIGIDFSRVQFHDTFFFFLEDILAVLEFPSSGVVFLLVPRNV